VEQDLVFETQPPRYANKKTFWTLLIGVGDTAIT
jgi:hypothetical protein